MILNVFYGFSQERSIDSVAILGLKKTKTSFIKRIVSVAPEQELDSLNLDLDIIKLKRLPGISHATYSVVKSKKV